MNHIRLIAILLCATSLWAQGLQSVGKSPNASTTSKPKMSAVAVLDLDGSALQATEMQALSGRFRAEILETGVVQVMERNQMDMILREQGFQQSGACNSQDCIVQMGQLLGVDKMIAGDIGKLGNTYLLTARIIDLQSGQIQAIASEECACPVEGLLPVLTRVSHKLLGVSTDVSATSSSSEGDLVTQFKSLTGKVLASVTKSESLSSSSISSSSVEISSSSAEAPKQSESPWNHRIWAFSLLKGSLHSGLFSSDEKSLPVWSNHQVTSNKAVQSWGGAHIQLEFPTSSTHFRYGAQLGFETGAGKMLDYTNLITGANQTLDYSESVVNLGLDGFAGLGDRWWWYLHIAMQGGAYRGSLSKSGTDWADFSAAHVGYGAGLGVRVPFGEHWGLDVEYAQYQISIRSLSSTSKLLGTAQLPNSIAATTTAVRAALLYRW